MPLSIERAAADSDESKQLMVDLCREVDVIYDNCRPTTPEIVGMDALGAAFVIARKSGKPIGCVALRPLSAEVAEVKRMYVQPADRKTGVARALMEKLEEIAREGRFREIWLETGLGQPAAIGLYESLGYERIPGFGDYQHDPVSVCYGKRLLEAADLPSEAAPD